MNYLAKVDQTPIGEGELFADYLNRLKDLTLTLVKYSNKEFTGPKGLKMSIGNILPVKGSLSAHGYDPSKGQGISQFAVKVEAAGKIRLFALLDTVSQTVLYPLHQLLFDLLRLIPNDGTKGIARQY